VMEKMGAVVKAGGGAVYLQRPVSGSFFKVWAEGNQGPVVLESKHPVIQYLEQEKAELLKEKRLWQYNQMGKGLAEENIEWLTAWPYALAIPFFIKHRFLGLIAFNDKTNGDMFNSDDIDLLKTLAEQAAVALNNAQGVAEMEAHYQAVKKNHDSALMGILATEIAHEVAKPLTRIMHEQTRLEATVKGPSQKSLKNIEKEARRATEIMDGFAMLSPQLPLLRSLTSLEDLFEEALSVLRIEKDGSIHILRQFSQLPKVPVNPGQIVQVLNNIIQNAWHAMQDKGTLTLSARVLEKAAEGAVVELSIQDTGPGVPAHLQDQVFKPFFTTKQQSGGRGVGLTISRAMVERHGGTIQMKSPVHEGRGTCVLIRLPLRLEEDLHEIP
jgi:two-component system, NtrC family, sensor kinase